jgi:hypothetical protein
MEAELHTFSHKMKAERNTASGLTIRYTMRQQQENRHEKSIYISVHQDNGKQHG